MTMCANGAYPLTRRNPLRLTAAVALVRDIVTDESCGVHRTAMKPDGSDKAIMPVVNTSCLNRPRL